MIGSCVGFEAKGHRCHDRVSRNDDQDPSCLTGTPHRVTQYHFGLRLHLHQHHCQQLDFNCTAAVAVDVAVFLLVARVKPHSSVLDLKAYCRAARYFEEMIKMLPEKPEPILQGAAVLSGI